MRGLVGGGTWKKVEEGVQFPADANEPRLECGQLWGEGGCGTMEEITVTVGIRVRQRRISGFPKLGRGSRFCNKNRFLIHIMAELRHLYSFIMVVIKHQWSALFLTGIKPSVLTAGKVAVFQLITR